MKRFSIAFLFFTGRGLALHATWARIAAGAPRAADPPRAAADAPHQKFAPEVEQLNVAA